MNVKEYKILIAYSLAWVPVFHTLQTAVNDCAKLKTGENLEPIRSPFAFTLHFFACSYLSFLVLGEVEESWCSGEKKQQQNKTEKYQEGKLHHFGVYCSVDIL